MKKTSNALLLTSIIFALAACAYVIFYNRVGEAIVEGHYRQHTGGRMLSLTEDFLDLQWFAFPVPIASFGVGLTMQKLQKPTSVFWIAGFLSAFALVWLFLAMFVWQNQSIPHYP